MVEINQKALAQAVQDYLKNPQKYKKHQYTFFSGFWDDLEKRTINLPYPEPSALFTTYRGIRFGHNFPLVFQLSERAFRGLEEKCFPAAFAEQISLSIAAFAKPFEERDNLCYPHFLLHGLEKSTAEEVAGKINENSRMIHETRTATRYFLEKYEKKNPLTADLAIGMSMGHTDDFFGLSLVICPTEDSWISSTSGYTAKTSFFIDTTNKSATVMTIQGQRADTKESKKTREGKIAGRRFARLSAELGMDTRAFLLRNLSRLLAEEGYKEIKVIRPSYHPMAIECHEGFLARYEPVIIQSGITHIDECYLKSQLPLIDRC